jgi:prevent-host-death family protein
MDEISVSKAKAHFLALVDKVGKTGKPVRVTKHGAGDGSVVYIRNRDSGKRDRPSTS